MAVSEKNDAEAMNGEARIRLVDMLNGKGAHLNFDNAIKDFPKQIINRKPANVPYSFWHMLEHIRMVQHDMLKYIADPGWQSPEWPAGYWPEQAETDWSGWQTTVESYHRDLAELIGMVDDRAANLLAPVEHMQNRSILRSVLILCDHTAYHLGEFVMARQILGEWRSNLKQ